MDKKKIRDRIRLVGALCFSFIYIPHLICCAWGAKKKKVISDVQRLSSQICVKLPHLFALLYLLHNNRYFRSLFYYRIGPIKSLIISWYRPGDRYFQLSKTMEMDEGCLIAHPYATILNANSIGKNFSVRHCTTLGWGKGGRPTIGDNVTLGATVTIIGDIKIGNNVVVGAGSVVVKDVPDNCVVAGNPAKIIRYINQE